MDSELRNKIESCQRTAEDFIKLYYNAFDKRRHQMGRLYLESGHYSWNGNGATGTANIQKLQIELPPSEHTVTTVDAQPIVDDAVAGQRTYIIMVSGTVKYTDQSLQSFQQSFMITAQEDKWKIASDCYRMQDVYAKQIES